MAPADAVVVHMAASKRWRSSATVGALVLLAALFAGCSSSPAGSEPTGYLFHDSNQAAYVQWTQTGSHVAGTLEDAYVDPSDPTKVTTGTQSLTGEISDGNITLTLDQSFLGATNLSGTFSGSVLVLGIPNNNGTINEVTFAPATVSTYNRDADELNGDANRAQAAQQQAQAAAAAQAQVSQDQGKVSDDAQAVTEDISSMSTDENFSSDIGSVTSSLAEEQKDLAQTQSDAKAEETEAQQNPGGDDGSVCADASGVGADASGVAAGASGVEASASGVEADLGSVRQDIKSLQADFATLQSDESTYNYTPKGAPTSATVSAAVSAATAAINSVIATTNGDISQAVTLFNGAAAAATQASQAGNCNLGTPAGPAGMTPIS